MATARIAARGRNLTIRVAFPCPACGASVRSNYCPECGMMAGALQRLGEVEMDNEAAFRMLERHVNALADDIERSNREKGEREVARLVRARLLEGAEPCTGSGARYLPEGPGRNGAPSRKRGGGSGRRH